MRKHYIVRILAIVMAVLVAGQPVTVLAETTDNRSAKELVSELTLTGPSTMTKGDREQFVAEITPDTIKPEEVLRWSSSKTSVATVDARGVVTAKEAGTAIISCRTTDGSAHTKSKFITVKEKTSGNSIPVSKIEIENGVDGNLDLMVGDREKLNVVITPGNASNKTLNWSSDDREVVTVDKDGNIEGIGPGTAEIEARSTDGYAVKATLTVHVTQPVSQISIAGKDTMKKGESGSYTANVLPTDYNEELTWSSSEPSVAVIDQNGKLTAKSIGSTTITCEGTVSGKKAAKTVKVITNGVPISSIQLKGEDVLAVGQNRPLEVTIIPSNATAYRFTSSNTAVATVAVNGMIFPKKAGTVTITCEATDGSGVRATKQITVKDKITSISLNKSTVSVDEGKTVGLTATVLPTTANAKAIKWTSADERIAKVSSTGVITGVNPGSTTIYCDSTDGSFISSAVTVTVLEVRNPVTKITVSGASTVKVGETIRLSAAVTPSGWQKDVVWSSSNNAVATVTSTGVVKGVKPGTVTITAKAGDKSAAKTISVNAGEVKIYDEFKYLDRNATVKLDATTTYGKLSYRSSNNAVATVDSQGIITCKGTGKVTITVTNGFVKKDITFTVGNYQSILRTGYKEVNVNAGSQVFIEVAGTKADIDYISRTNTNVNAIRYGVGFYKRSISVRAEKKGITYVTVFNSSGYGCTIKVNVLSSTDTRGTRGLSYDARTTKELFDQINTYRRQKGLKPCRFNQAGQTAAIAQIISGHRMAEKNPNYDYALHNNSQLSCYYFGTRSYVSKYDAGDFLTAWKKSPGHNRALLTSDYTDMGVAVYYTPYGYCAFMTIGDSLNNSGLLGHKSPAHTHGYISTVSRATPSRHGKIVKKCICGASGRTSTIYAPKKMYLSTSKYTYSGKVRKPSVKIKDSKGRTISSSNYKVTYSKGRKYVGRYTVKVTFRGNYSGTMYKKFDIVPKKTSVSKVSKGRKSFTVKWRRNRSQTSGYQVQYSTNSKFKKGNKTVTIKSNKSSSKKIKKLRARRKYYVRVRTYKNVKISGKTVRMYSGWSKAKAVRTR